VLASTFIPSLTSFTSFPNSVWERRRQETLFRVFGETGWSKARNRVSRSGFPNGVWEPEQAGKAPNQEGRETEFRGAGSQTEFGNQEKRPASKAEADLAAQKATQTAREVFEGEDFWWKRTQQVDVAVPSMTWLRSFLEKVWSILKWIWDAIARLFRWEL